jgi:hypothetical protein
MPQIKVYKFGVAYASQTLDSEIASPQDHNRAKSEDQPTEQRQGGCRCNKEIS